MPTKEVSVEEILTPELLHQRSIPEMVLDWTKELVTRLEEDYKRRYPDSHHDKKFEIVTGRKYLKINQYDLDRKGERWSGGVHAFVDKNTGEVYKPASWKSPAAHVRYDLRLISDRAKCYQNADWAGGYLYLRG